jgi:hypothetical protein
MKLALLRLLCAISLLSGCDSDERARELEKRTEELDKREETLVIMERALKLKEEDLVQREKSLDSSASAQPPDTLASVLPAVAGMWSVTMRCTETTCPGSAVGDVKTEQWDLSFQANQVIAKAINEKKVTRVYSGHFLDNMFQLSADTDSTATPAARILVRFEQVRKDEMRGERQIIRGDECRIVYSLELRKLQ